MNILIVMLVVLLFLALIRFELRYRRTHRNLRHHMLRTGDPIGMAFQQMPQDLDMKALKDLAEYALVEATKIPEEVWKQTDDRQ